MLSLFLALFYTPPRFYTNSNSLKREKVLSRKDPLVISGGVKQGAFNIRLLHLLLEQRQTTSQTFHFLFQAEISNKRASNEQKLGRSGGWVSIFFTVQANRGPHIKRTPSMWVDTMQVEPQFPPKIYYKPACIQQTPLFSWLGRRYCAILVHKTCNKRTLQGLLPLKGFNSFNSSSSSTPLTLFSDVILKENVR